MPKLRRKGYKKRSTKVTAAAAMKVAKVAIKRSKPESKWFNWEFDNTISTSGQVFDLLPGIGNGTSVNNFIGDQLKLKSLSLRGFFTHGNAGAASVRVIILRYFDENLAGPPDISDILATTGPYLFTAYKNPVKTRDSKFLVDRTYALQAFSGESTVTDIQNIKIYLNLKNVTVQFAENSGMKIEKRGLYMLVLPTASMDFAAHAITHYTDS